jgi:putative ATPase
VDLFKHAASLNNGLLPLAEAMRPTSLEELVGQEKIIGVQSQLGQLIRKGYIPNLILWGPPGTGKTSFATALSRQTGFVFVNLNATEAGVKALREAGENGHELRLSFQKKTLLFVDEIHRFTKSQQDVLLPYLEKGDVTLIGATTENPSYELNRALLSRCQVIIFNRLDTKALEKIYKRCLDSRNLQKDFLAADALEHLFRVSDGDARRLLNTLEVIFEQANLKPENSKENTQISKELLLQTLAHQPLSYDKKSEVHYDVISAFIKSIRGSDPDAAMYYLARMLLGGEDPLFIARRLLILASEDISNADPRALQIALSGFHAVEVLGLPECEITLSQVTCYLASAPKSNRSYLALHKAKDLASRFGSLQVPLHLRSSKTETSKSLGIGVDYKYPHDFAAGWVKQKYLPDEFPSHEKIYEPSHHGFEKTMNEYMNWLRQSRS